MALVDEVFVMWHDYVSCEVEGEVSSGRKNKENIVFKDGIGVKGYHLFQKSSRLRHRRLLYP